MSSSDVIHAMEQATACMLLFNEQSNKEFGGIDE